MRIQHAALVILLSCGCHQHLERHDVHEAGVSLEFPCTPAPEDIDAGVLFFHQLKCHTSTEAASLIWWQERPELDTSRDAGVILERAQRNFSRPFYVDGRFFYDVNALRAIGVVSVAGTAEKARHSSASVRLLAGEPAPAARTK